MRTIWLVTLAFVGILAGYSLNVKVPDGCSQPNMLRALVAPVRLFDFLGKISENVWGPEINFYIFRVLYSAICTGIRSDERVQVTSETFNGVPVRLYVPKVNAADTGVFFIHGGGWTFGSPGLYDELAREYTYGIGAVTVSVDYRLAPPNKYPDHLEDCEKAFKYFISHAIELGFDPNRVAITGDSAGGNLAAALTLKLRDTKYTPMPKLQVLKYPALQAIDFNTPSYHAHQDDSLLYRKLMVGMWIFYMKGYMDYSLLDIMTVNNHTNPETKRELYSSYLNTSLIQTDFYHHTYQANKDNYGDEEVWASVKDILMDPYYSPLMAKDLSNLPETYVMTMEQDVLRDDGLLYVRRLREAGNDVTHEHYEHAIHGMSIFIWALEDGHRITYNMLNYIRERL